MNEEFELRKRLQDADPGRTAPALSESVVAKAALSKPKRFTSFKLARFTTAAASLSIVGLAITSVSLLQPASNEPLFSLAGAGQPAQMSTDASATMESGVAEPGRVADSMIMPWYRYNYVAGDLSTATGRGKVYQAELIGDPLQILTRLADYFEIEAEPKLDEWSTPEFPSYSVTTENMSLGLYFSGAGNWYYSSWSDYDFGCVSESTEPDQERSSEYCEPKPTPELIPLEGELIRQAAELFRNLGSEVDTSAARVWRDDWGASVSFPNIQSGINTGMDFYVGWDMTGEISYASGFSFRLVERGEFDTISALDAVPRIADGRWYGGAPSIYYEDLVVTDAAVSSPMARSEGEEFDAEVEISEPETEFIPEEPEILDLKVIRSEAVTLSVFDQAGNFWFVPGYLLFNEQGWFDSIISLEDGVIELPEPLDFDIMPMVEPLPEG